MEVESGESLVLSHPHHLYFPTDFTLPNFFINKQLKHAKFNLKIKNSEYLLELEIVFLIKLTATGLFFLCNRTLSTSKYILSVTLLVKFTPKFLKMKEV